MTRQNTPRSLRTGNANVWLTETQPVAYRDDDARKPEQHLRGHLEAFQAYSMAISLCRILGRSEVL